MKIPVFVSSPTSLDDSQEKVRQSIFAVLHNLNLEPRALGQSDYPTDLPLREVYVIAKHCAGGVILGFSQFVAQEGTSKPGTSNEKKVANAKYPSPWNHLEAGVLFSLGLPLLVFREEGISGGVFDDGVTDVFVHRMPGDAETDVGVREVFLKWRSKVDRVYYSFSPPTQMQ